MSVDRVRAWLRPYHMEDRVREFAVSSATVQLAAQALGVEEARIAKTLSFLLQDGCAVVVAAGDARIDNGKFKAFFHEKARMLPHELVEELTGYPVGGVCPFALKDGVKVYLDVSLKRFDEIYPAAGTPSSAVRLSCDELALCARAASWVDVCKCSQ